MTRRANTQEQRQAIYDRHSSDRAIYTTPALREFVARPDVTFLSFPSGAWYVYVGDRSFYGDTKLAATEAAMKGMNG